MAPWADYLEGRCRRCGNRFLLRDLLDDRTGLCTYCRRPLSPDWTEVMLDEAAHADHAQQQLVKALRRLVGLPGNLEVVPHVVLRNALEQIGWEQDLENDPEAAAREAAYLREQADRWAASAMGSRDHELRPRGRWRWFGGRRARGEAVTSPARARRGGRAIR
jgi:hypothetical protein